MKLLMITGSFPPLKCGVGDYGARLATALAGLDGVEVRVLTSCGAEAAADDTGVTVLPIMASWRLSEAPRLTRVLREWKPDVVHVQYPTQGYGFGTLPSLTPIIAYLHGARVVRTWHESYGLRRAHNFIAEALPPGPVVVVRPNFRDLLPRLLRSFIVHQRIYFIPGASSIARQELSTDERLEIRARFLGRQKRLIVHFGFTYPLKGVDRIFRIANPQTDHLVIAGEVAEDYGRQLHEIAARQEWKGKVSFTGFVNEGELGRLIAAANAVVLPFLQGGGIWNSSILAAVHQGTPIITTTIAEPHYDDIRQISFSAVDDIEAMSAALDRLAGSRRAHSPVSIDDWATVARRHLALYRVDSCLDQNLDACE